MEYDTVINSYVISWASSTMNKINVLEVYQKDDTSGEVYVVESEGDILIYDLLSLELVNKIETGIRDINQIKVCDADNDQVKELVFCTDDEVYLYNYPEYYFERKFDYGGNDFELANVFGDSNKELVFSEGDVINIVNETATFYWDYTDEEYNNNYIVDAADIDNDGFDEIVCAKSWEYISVFDADVKALKFQIIASHDIQALLVDDYNSDDTVDIVYGDGQWGEIHFVNSITQQEYKSVSNPEHGVTEVNIADVDMDGELEVLWGAGWTSTGPDNLFIADIASEEIEYASMDITGPFYTVEIGDVDDDGEQELVVISYESNSGYDSGIITVFDAETKAIEWQCDGDFLGMAWTGIYTSELYDIDGDNLKELIVAAGDTYDGRIWVIDLKNYVIQDEHTYGYGSGIDIGEFYGLGVGDTDNDGTIEYVATAGNSISIISSVDYSVEWSYDDLFSYAKVGSIIIENLDDDQAPEILFCANKIYTIDGITKSLLTSAENNYNSVSLFDYNNDGTPEILAATNYGSIQLLTTDSLKVVNEFPVSDEEINNVHGLRYNGSNLLVLTANSALYIYNATNDFLVSEKLGDEAGRYDALKISDYKGVNEPAIFVGSNHQVVEFSSEMLQCLSFELLIEVTPESCLGQDGSITSILNGGTPPYNYQWSNNNTTNKIENLDAGDYILTATDAAGCSKVVSGVVDTSVLKARLEVSNVTCDSINNGKIESIITEGTGPYEYNWNNGSADESLNNLVVGEYLLTITDAMHCADTLFAAVEKDDLTVEIEKSDASCPGVNDGYIRLYVDGETPINYIWSNGKTGSMGYYLNGGEYNITITDANNCTVDTSVILKQPQNIEMVIETQPDDTNTVIGEGIAEVVDVIGGTAPYFLSWNDPFGQNTPKATNLIDGEYIVSLIDANQCEASDTVIVEYLKTSVSEYANPSFEYYPNPAKDKVVLTFDSPGKKTIQIIGGNGGVVYSKITPRQNVSININELDQGMFLLKVVTEQKVYSRVLMIR